MENFFYLIESLLPETLKKDYVVFIVAFTLISLSGQALKYIFRQIMNKVNKEKGPIALAYLFVIFSIFIILFTVYENESQLVFQITIAVSAICLYLFHLLINSSYARPFLVSVVDDVKIKKEEDFLDKCLSCSKKTIFVIAIVQKDQTCGVCNTTHTIDRHEYKKVNLKFMLLGISSLGISSLILLLATRLFQTNTFILLLLIVFSLGLSIYVIRGASKEYERKLRELIVMIER